jgi:hypothetical protein
MSIWKLACGAAIVAVGLASPVHADEYTKLTLLTFSGPVDIPGKTLPAGTYRFALADPATGRRVVKVSDKDGTKTLGMFLSIPNQRMTPSDQPVVMFKEAVAGAPPAVQAWFYPGESYGYEFAYPHDQALKIAKASHQSVLSYTDKSGASASDEDRAASMKNAEVARIDENDKPVSTDEALKESSEPRTPVKTAPSRSQTAVGTSGTTSPAPAPGSSSVATRATGQSAPPAPARKHLPRTASELPLLALLGTLSLAGGFGLRLARKAV